MFFTALLPKRRTSQQSHGHARIASSTSTVSTMNRLSSVPVSPTRKRNVSVTLSIAEIEAVMVPTQDMSTAKLVFRRAMAAVLMLGILAAGIMVKFIIPVPEHDAFNDNSTTVTMASYVTPYLATNLTYVTQN